MKEIEKKSQRKVRIKWKQKQKNKTRMKNFSTIRENTENLTKHLKAVTHVKGYTCTRMCKPKQNKTKSRQGKVREHTQREVQKRKQTRKHTKDDACLKSTPSCTKISEVCCCCKGVGFTGGCDEITCVLVCCTYLLSSYLKSITHDTAALRLHSNQTQWNFNLIFISFDFDDTKTTKTPNGRQQQNQIMCHTIGQTINEHGAVASASASASASHSKCDQNSYKNINEKNGKNS